MTDHRVGQLETPSEPSPDRRTGPRYGQPERSGPYPEAAGSRRPDDPITVGRAAVPPPALPRSSRLPLLVTAAVLLVAVLIVGLATAVSLRPEPAPVAAPEADPVTLAGTGTRIGFRSAEGAGTLALQQHHWVRDPTWPSASGSRLLVQVRVTGSSGSVSVDSSLFQLFDARGGLYDSQTPTPSSPPLRTGTLRAGESASGWVAFDLPRGDVTLVLSDPSGRAVTALRVDG